MAKCSYCKTESGFLNVKCYCYSPYNTHKAGVSWDRCVLGKGQRTCPYKKKKRK